MSLVSLIPAVSRRVTGMPQTVTFASITSLVVPAISVTIALSLCTLKNKCVNVIVILRVKEKVAKETHLYQTEISIMRLKYFSMF